LKTVG